ncbi:F-box domain containing protein [Acanthamoeba castellanii str. Neff]|uniref:F-box domain containing protein n=1 Tax=Acanthamoeba castellanii (strain ATCC 30010 / Neff) TaxID=1257118 RepID=L8GMM3_ACACF|nr:F-box domain containing protein [Acanthamoeba castellanii str. Neff]ELR14003.1 F-box domain containing protein [Acanthamoeba castellanii str. Neff]
MQLLSLPREVVGLVLLYVDDEDVLRFEQTCSLAQSAAGDDFLWRQRALRYLPEWIAPAPRVAAGEWRAYYRQRCALKERWRSGRYTSRFILEGANSPVLSVHPITVKAGGPRALVTVTELEVLTWDMASGRHMCSILPGPETNESSGLLAVLGERSLDLWDLAHATHSISAVPVLGATCLSGFRRGRDKRLNIAVGRGHNVTLVVFHDSSGSHSEQTWPTTSHHHRHRVDADAEEDQIDGLVVKFIELYRSGDADLSVACGHADGSVSVWTAQGQLRFRIESPTRSSMTCFDVAEDQSIAVAGDKTARLWKRIGDRSWEPSHTLTGHNGAAVAGDYGRVASSSRDSVTRLWDVQSGECIGLFKDHMNGVTAVYLDNTSLITGSADWTVIVHQFA